MILQFELAEDCSSLSRMTADFDSDKQQ